jgi:hypothetical protein
MIPAQIVHMEVTMLWSVGVVLVFAWLLGLVANITLGGFIHLLLVLALIAVLIRATRGPEPVRVKAEVRRLID